MNTPTQLHWELGGPAEREGESCKVGEGAGIKRVMEW
jgi:hypothetical protein